MPDETRWDGIESLGFLYEAEGGVPSAFSTRVLDYAAYRPAYPKACFDFLAEHYPPSNQASVVEVASGTGLFTRGLLERGYGVICIEPSQEMREVAERNHGSSDCFRSIAGTAECIPLSSACTDLIIAAQALHWFNIGASRKEFLRVLKPGGEVAIISNDGIRDDPIRTAVHEVLSAYCGTKRAVLRAQGDEAHIHRFFRACCPQIAYFANEQLLDKDGFAGLVFSGSFVPLRTSDSGKQLLVELQDLFRRFQIHGKITVRYQTSVHLGRPA